MPVVSVNIITFNRASFLFRCLQSVLHQTIEDFEIVIVDDGSTDDTRGIVQAFKDKRLQYYYYDHSGKIGLLRNVAISHSNSDFIAMIDSDDLWEPHKLETQMRFMEAQGALDFSFTDILINMGGNSKRLFTQHENYYNRRIIPTLFADWFILPSTVMFRRCVTDQVGFFNTELTSAVEPEYFLRIIRRGKYGALSEPLTTRTIHSSQRSLTSGIGSYDVMVMLAGEYYRNGSISFLEQKRLLSLLQYRLGCELGKLGQKDKSQSNFAKSITNNPFNIRAWARLMLPIP